MALGVGMKCIKFLVFFFNFLFALSGLVILVTGVVIQTVYKRYLEFVPDEIFSAPILLIVVGVIVFVVAFFGCCGAIKESRCMILTFAVFLSIIFILELAAGIAAYLHRQDIDSHITSTMTASLENYNKPDKMGVKSTWDWMQLENECCGVKNYTDWYKAFNDNKVVPTTCCKPNQVQCKGETITITDDNVNVIYHNGCYATVSRILKENIATIGGIAIGIAFIQVIGICFAYCLSKSIRNSYETV